MRSTIKRGCVMLAALFMVVGIATSCGGKDHAASPVKSTAAPTLSEAEAPVMSEAEATDIATEAYAYAYPLVTMEYTRRGLTNVARGRRHQSADGTGRAHAPVPRTPRSTR